MLKQSWKRDKVDTAPKMRRENLVLQMAVAVFLFCSLLTAYLKNKFEV